MAMYGKDVLLETCIEWYVAGPCNPAIIFSEWFLTKCSQGATAVSVDEIYDDRIPPHFVRKQVSQSVTSSLVSYRAV